METSGIPHHYLSHDGRLASFQSAQPVMRRNSNVKGRAPKALTWPHKRLDPDVFARAGFFFEPTLEWPDNAVCFLCLKNMGGWEEDDNPFEEHLRLSPDCGWAIVAAVEAGLADFAMRDPTSSQMIEARKATFGTGWPHEGKRGWKCKTKQLVDAGWKYTPTIDSDDMATCTYCQLALDGWEPKDNPMDEHYRRSPDCPFFNLINHYKSAVPAKKKGRGKGVRSSKASRVSGQSIATVASDLTSLLDHRANPEDSVLTTNSVMTQGGTKRTRAKKGTAAKPRKTRAKKDDAVKVLEDPPEAQEDVPPTPPPKPVRGRKRASDAVEDLAITAAEAPALKKRVMRGRPSDDAEPSTAGPQGDGETANSEPASLSKIRGRKTGSSNTRSMRKASSTSTNSAASSHEGDGHLVDDEAFDRQLQADMERPLTDDEDIEADSDSERKRGTRKLRKNKLSSTANGVQYVQEQPTNDDHAMFDAAPPEIDEAAVDAELEALEAEVNAGEFEDLDIQHTRYGAGTDKTSDRTAKKIKKISNLKMVRDYVPESLDENEALDELADGHDTSIASNATALRNSPYSSSSAPKKRGRPSKKTVVAKSAQDHVDRLNEEVNPGHDSAPKHADLVIALPKAVQASMDSSMTGAQPLAPEVRDKPLPPAPNVQEAGLPATPRHNLAPAPAAKQATVSPSQSPQSSDAENQPPSSKPSETATSKRGALAPVTATPVRPSPSKRNIFAGLQSNRTWTAVDVELIFEELEKENAIGPVKFSKGDVDLASPEKAMTVEEWIYHNASQAELRLKTECEAMVTAFEQEGSKAMQALDGLVVQ